MADYDDGGESFYGDDDLDQLPQDTLIELENNAIQYTQARTQARLKDTRSEDFCDNFKDQGLDDVTVCEDDFDGTTIKIPSFQSNNAQVALGQNKFQRDNPTLPHNDPLILNLKRQIDELINEKNALKEDLNIKTGEIAIVRAKQEKISLEYERQLTAVQKQKNEELEQKQKALEAARLAEKNAAIERDFIKRDLAEESERVRQLNRMREREKRNNEIHSPTPKKEQNPLPHRDGFDKEEIQALSPSNHCSYRFQKNLIVSPSKPVWRKRKYIESSADALEASEEIIQIQVEHKPTTLSEVAIDMLSIQDDRFDFMRSMLDHRFDEKHLRTIQELGKYALPSSPNQTLQTLLFTKLPDLGNKRSVDDFPINFCKFLISIWTSCMEEKYYKPIYLLIDILTLALEMKTTTVAPHIIDSLLPIAQRTADLVAIPRFQSHPTDKHDKDINLTSCMTIIYLASLGCMSESPHITEFWRLMRWDFVLLMLSTNQFKADYELMLQLISTSVMNDSLGALPGGEKQHLQTGWIIDRLTYPLSEHPCKPMSTEQFEKKDLNHIRLQILRLMTSMIRSPYASEALVTHPHAIGRLICLISDELDVLYDFNSRCQESAQIINIGTRLLHHLIIKNEKATDVQRNLSNIHGGSQKYLLSLSRLHFAEEDLVLESMIDPDISGFALELLELIVTPEEGDAIQLAFSN